MKRKVIRLLKHGGIKLNLIVLAEQLRSGTLAAGDRRLISHAFPGAIERMAPEALEFQRLVPSASNVQFFDPKGEVPR